MQLGVDASRCAALQHPLRQVEADDPSVPQFGQRHADQTRAAAGIEDLGTRLGEVVAALGSDLGALPHRKSSRSLS